jgi:3D (Asp-Asp-Asp) domain-containing protein
MYRLNYFIFIFLTALYFTGYAIDKNVLGAQTGRSKPGDSVKIKTEIVTTTAFDQKELTEDVPIEFETKYEEDDDLEYGLEEVKQLGVNGVKHLTYLVTYWQDDEIDRVLKSTLIEDPVNEIISKGTKIIWRMLEGTEYGRLKYWHKKKVWATKYDANCIGCTGRTYSGTAVKKGVCATDPNVIPLGTNFYVPGYGLCRAEDIGGAIKGDKIDLGYEDVSKGEWRTGWAEVYLLTNAPGE